MIDLNRLRQDPDAVRKSVVDRGIDPARVDVERFLELDAQRRQLQARFDSLRHEQGDVGKQIPTAAPEQKPELIARLRNLKTELAEVEAHHKEVHAQHEQLWRLLPNFLSADAPLGRTDEDNVELKTWGTLPEFDFDVRDHVQLGKLTGTIDFERAAKVTGARFYYLAHEGALLEQALLAYAANQLLPEGFVPIRTPDLARDEVLQGIGFQPRGPETQIYSIEDSDLSLIGTAEITLGGMHRDEILPPGSLPRKYLGFSSCFRTEAGTHGRESRGLYRVHQFSKAEMFVICAPEQAEQMHEDMLGYEERIYRGLGIPYRVVNVCSGDLGAPATKKYDIEAWMPGRRAYGEVTSCSNCTDYQARRLGIRYRPEKKAKPLHPYLLNGTAIATSRTLIAVMENNQRADGSVAIPAELQPFMFGITEIPLRESNEIR